MYTDLKKLAIDLISISHEFYEDFTLTIEISAHQYVELAFFKKDDSAKNTEEVNKTVKIITIYKYRLTDSLFASKTQKNITVLFEYLTSPNTKFENIVEFSSLA